jgi:hypothetical protein
VKGITLFLSSFEFCHILERFINRLLITIFFSTLDIIWYRLKSHLFDNIRQILNIWIIISFLTNLALQQSFFVHFSVLYFHTQKSVFRWVQFLFRPKEAPSSYLSTETAIWLRYFVIFLKWWDSILKMNDDYLRLHPIQFIIHNSCSYLHTRDIDSVIKSAINKIKPKNFRSDVSGWISSIGWCVSGILTDCYTRVCGCSAWRNNVRWTSKRASLYMLHPVVCHSKQYICIRQHNKSAESNDKNYLN